LADDFKVNLNRVCFESEVLIDQQFNTRNLNQANRRRKVTRQKYRKEVVLAVSDERSLASKLLPGKTLKSMVGSL